MSEEKKSDIKSRMIDLLKHANYTLPYHSHPLYLAANVADMYLTITEERLEEYIEEYFEEELSEEVYKIAMDKVIRNKFYLYIRSAVKDGTIKDYNTFNKFVISECGNLFLKEKKSDHKGDGATIGGRN
jgi:hypothetical protein